MPAHGIVEEFERAKNEVRKDHAAIHVWQPIISRYFPTMVGECEKAIKWSNEMVADWLTSGMFKGQKRRASMAARVIKELGDHALTKSHDRHLSAEKCKAIGLKIFDLEADQELQDSVLAIHHCMTQTFSGTPAVKIIENHKGAAFIIGLPKSVMQVR